MQRVQHGDFSYACYGPLVKLVIQKAPDVEIWTAVYESVIAASCYPFAPAPNSALQAPTLHSKSSFVYSSEYQTHAKSVLKEVVGNLHVDVPGFLEALFRRGLDLDSTARAVLNACMDGETPQYDTEKGWSNWPEPPVENKVLNWLTDLVEKLRDFAEAHDPAVKIKRKLTQPYRSLEECIPPRNLDVCFNDGPSSEDPRCHWSQILVPGGIKQDPSHDEMEKAWLDLAMYARDVFALHYWRRFVLGFTLCGPFFRVWQYDRLGGIASERFDINANGHQFVSVILTFLLISSEQLGYDPAITRHSIEMEKDGKKERFVIDAVLGRSPRISGRGTTCWKVYRDDPNEDLNEPRTSLVIKD